MSEAKIRDEILQALKVEKEMVTFLWLSAKFNIHVNAAKRILDEFYKEYKDEENLHAIFYLSGYQNVGENQFHRIFFVNENLLQEHIGTLDVVLSCHTYCVHTAEIKDLIAPYISDQCASLSPSLRAILPLDPQSDKESKSKESPKSKKLGKRLSSGQSVTTPLNNSPPKIPTVNSSMSSDQRSFVSPSLEHSVHNNGTEVSLSKANSEHLLSNDLFTAVSSPESSPQKKSGNKEKKSSKERKRRVERKRKEAKSSRPKNDQQSSPETTVHGSNECDSFPSVNTERSDKPSTLSDEAHKIRRRKTSFKTFVDDDDYLVTKQINETEVVIENSSTATDLQRGASMEEHNGTSKPASFSGKSRTEPKKKQNPLTNFFKKL